MKRQNPNLKLSEVLYIWLSTVPPCGQVGKNQGEKKITSQTRKMSIQVFYFYVQVKLLPVTASFMESTIK